MRVRRGSTQVLVNAGYAVSGTRCPNPTSGSNTECDIDGGDRQSGGARGAHEERREYGADVLRVRCWCQHRIVDVPSDVVRRAETLSCGRSECAKGNY